MAKTAHEINLRRDLTKLAVVLVILGGSMSIFFFNPTLSGPCLLSVVVTMLLGPLVASLERQGIQRTLAITLIFLAIAVLLASLGVWAATSITNEWAAFSTQVPVYFNETVNRVRELEQRVQSNYPFLKDISPTDSVIDWAQETGNWFLVNGPALFGGIFSWLFLVPIISFVLLKDGRSVRKRFFDLVPNRFFEQTFMVSSRITAGLSDYVRAKIVEALLMFVLSTTGFLVLDVPYALVLGMLVGITNIVPYLGPFLGAAPALIVVGLDPFYADKLLGVSLVLIITNLIDMLFVFPVLVAKLVNLHPVVLITIVILGQQYYGVLGMLLSIPLATAIKVILAELYGAIYERHMINQSSIDHTLSVLDSKAKAEPGT